MHKKLEEIWELLSEEEKNNNPELSDYYHEISDSLENADLSEWTYEECSVEQGLTDEDKDEDAEESEEQ